MWKRKINEKTGGRWRKEIVYIDDNNKQKGQETKHHTITTTPNWRREIKVYKTTRNNKLEKLETEEKTGGR